MEYTPLAHRKRIGFLHSNAVYPGNSADIQQMLWARIEGGLGMTIYWAHNYEELVYGGRITMKAAKNKAKGRRSERAD